ncbi:hypothetical protein PI125_g11608 [Phytophthora idaei]|nr:hypothetical protein PI125_g11608 [Phytophthora idaei]
MSPILTSFIDYIRGFSWVFNLWIECGVVRCEQSTAVTGTSGVIACSGVITTSIGSVISSAAVRGSSASSSVISTGSVWYTGMCGGFTFVASAGSGAMVASGVNVAHDAGVVASAPAAWIPRMFATSAWPSVPSLGSAAFALAFWMLQELQLRRWISPRFPVVDFE